MPEGPYGRRQRSDRLPVTASAVIVGGGYAGWALAGLLDATLDVCVVEPNDTFVHSIAALRGPSQDEWTPRVFLDYSGCRY